jgi:hypothetical protein
MRHEFAAVFKICMARAFIVTPEEAARNLEASAPIKPYRNGRDLTDRPRGVNDH